MDTHQTTPQNPTQGTPTDPRSSSSPVRPHLVPKASPASVEVSSSPVPLYYVGGRAHEPQTTSSPTSSPDPGRARPETPTKSTRQGTICGTTQTTLTGTWTCTHTGPHRVLPDGRTCHVFTKTTHTPKDAA